MHSMQRVLMDLQALILQEIDLGDGQTTYDPNFLDRPSHNHLVCVDCGKVVEFLDPAIERRQEKIAADHGFKLADHNLTLYGHCKDCQAKPRRRSR